MDVAEAIHQADAILPGEPVDEGQDPRWQAIIAVGEFVQSEPEAVWSFIQRWGSHPQEDLRDAVATCLLEHLLEHHFTPYFAQVQRMALSDKVFADTFSRCWQFGQALEPGNAELHAILRAAVEAKRHAEQSDAADSR